MEATTADRFTVSLMAETETQEGVFEDVILGTYATKRAAITIAREHVKVNAESQAQIIAALPHQPAFGKMASLEALVYRDFDFGDEPSGVIVESF
jgi:hypothetical protein